MGTRFGSQNEKIVPYIKKMWGSRIPFPCYVSTLQECLMNFLDEKLQHTQSGSCKTFIGYGAITVLKKNSN
jgi:hypothetical protein